MTGERGGEREREREREREKSVNLCICKNVSSGYSHLQKEMEDDGKSMVDSHYGVKCNSWKR
jgi:hypothetical protein